jgi:hypothetical protein
VIIFENKGELDIRAIKTFGVNSKDNPDSAIGYFGTGLKYAIAILLRTGHQVTIITGGVEYNFGILRTQIRNDEFDIVTMNGEELGFTTDTGKNWELWTAYRELHSNMLDEQGTVYEAPMIRMTTEDKTYVIVTGTSFATEYAKRDHYFLNKEQFKPLHTFSEVDIYPKTHDNDKGHVFYKGVRVMQTQLPALYDYNHHIGLRLTEDRTISNTWSTLYHVAPLVTRSTDKAFIKQMVMAKNVYESNIDYTMNQGGDLMNYFLDVVGKLRTKYKDRGINHSAIELHKKHRGKTDVMPGISCHLNSVQTKQLDRATNFCKDTLNLDLDDYKLIVCKDIADDLGRANIDEGIMYISKKCFDQGTKRVAVALLEEYTHCKHEVLDETAEQKWVYLEQIISLGERLDGEPL